MPPPQWSNIVGLTLMPFYSNLLLYNGEGNVSPWGVNMQAIDPRGIDTEPSYLAIK